MYIGLIFALMVSAAVVVYTYLGYPAVVAIASRLFGRRPLPPNVGDDELPCISLLIAACDEERYIAKRIANALAMDYPKDRLQIVVASDGSTDQTAAIVRRSADPRVQLLDYSRRRGKAAVLNDSVPRLTGEIVLFSDANTFFEADAARRLVYWFSDCRVVAVCGRLVLTDPVTGRNIDSTYWRYETFLKRCEGRLGALLGANGAIYALRRTQFVGIPDDTIIDDFVIPLTARLRHGGDIIYDDQAVAHEECPPEIRDEFRRRARIGAGGFQSLRRLWPLLVPTKGWVAFTFFSHKLLRWLCPFFLLVALMSNVLLLPEPIFVATLAGQVAFYAMSWLGGRLHGRGRVARCLRLGTMFTSMNAALLAGFWRWLTGRQGGIWQRTAR
jgi:cellulose synthase/poly-beta-1,6-N-acetylglucosamine synthase-like glycosyltransferase